MTKMRLRGLAALVVLALASVTSQGASASTYKVLYSFCSQMNCADGGDGLAGLLRDPSGALYGAAFMGGAHNQGTVFALTQSAGSWQYQVLYSFCAELHCTDGALPKTALIEDTQGNLYGTTLGGGAQNGTVFKLTHDAGRTAWTLTQLYVFCSSGGSCTDGTAPNSSLTYKGAASGAAYDGVSPLYGTTQVGGGSQAGVVYQLTPTESGPWTQTVLDDLCRSCGTGITPGGGAIMDESGNLFVNTTSGGAAGDGTIIELSQKHNKWKATQIYSFCAAKNCRDGTAPGGRLVLDAMGDLIGTAIAGGKKDGGALFELSPAGHKWKEQVLYNFCRKKNCADGDEPVGVALDGAGNIIGTAQSGGTSANMGTAYRFNGGTFDLLYQFCQDADSCSDGEQPESPPVADGSGNLFGTTYQGGLGGGVIYEITP